MCSAVLLFALLMAAAVDAALLFPGTTADRLWSLNPAAEPWFNAHRALGMTLVLIAGATAGLAGVGLWRGRRWGWWLAVVVFAVNGLGDAGRLLTGRYREGFAGVAIVAVFLVLLGLPATRRYAHV